MIRLRIKVAFSALLLAVTLTAGAGSVSGIKNARLVFLAGKYSREARLGTLTAADLGHATKAQNIIGILDLAVLENRIDPIQSGVLSRRYQAFADGDALLLTCLRNSACRPDRFLDIVGTSHLHAEVARRAPGLSMQQVNNTVGALTESLMDRYFESSGWTKIEGQIGRQGIDGLYVKLKAGVIKDVLIAESKYNTSLLQQTLDGSQMSAVWISRRVDKLAARFPDQPVYRDIKRFVDADAYRAVLWGVKVDENSIHLSLKKVIAKGREIEFSNEPPLEGLPTTHQHRISLSAPASPYETQFVGWYRAELDAVGILPN